MFFCLLSSAAMTFVFYFIFEQGHWWYCLRYKQDAPTLATHMTTNNSHLAYFSLHASSIPEWIRLPDSCRVPAFEIALADICQTNFRLCETREYMHAYRVFTVRRVPFYSQRFFDFVFNFSLKKKSTFKNCIFHRSEIYLF